MLYVLDWVEEIKVRRTKLELFDLYKVCFDLQMSQFQTDCFWEAISKAFSSVCVNSLPHEKILDWSKLKAFAEDKIKVTEKLKFVLGRVENTVGKGENAGYQHFLLFPQCFQKASVSGASKVGIVW